MARGGVFKVHRLLARVPVAAAGSYSSYYNPHARLGQQSLLALNEINDGPGAVPHF
jgi:hypothetical protein